MAEPFDGARRINAAVRASDEDRDRCAAVLVENYSAGFFDYEILQARLDLALVAVSRPELAALVADLPMDTAERPVPTHANFVRSLPGRGRMAVVGIAVVGVAVTAGLLQGASIASPSQHGVCIVTGVSPGEGEECPVPTRVQREIQRSVDRAAAAAVQAAAVADGAGAGSRVQDLAQAAQRASEEATAAQAEAQAAAATAEPGSHGAIAAAARRADQAADDAARAAIQSELEVAK